MAFLLDLTTIHNHNLLFLQCLFSKSKTMLPLEMIRECRRGLPSGRIRVNSACNWTDQPYLSIKSASGIIIYLHHVSSWHVYTWKGHVPQWKCSNVEIITMTPGYYQGCNQSWNCSKTFIITWRIIKNKCMCNWFDFFLSRLKANNDFRVFVSINWPFQNS